MTKIFKDSDSFYKMSKTVKEGEIIRLEVNNKVDFKFTVGYINPTGYKMIKVNQLTPVKRTINEKE